MALGPADRVRRDVVDGVTVFWVPDAPRAVGSLQFRVGRSDETLLTAGASHLVEHLTMFALGRRAFPANGAVDDIRTMFFATGTGADVAGFLREAAAQVTRPPVDRLGAERRVLRTEATQRPFSIAAQHLALRYGPHGFGLSALPELGLHTLTAAQISDWAATRFCAGAAVATLAGTVPDTLGFPLPDGPRRPIVTRTPLSNVPARSWHPVRDFQGVAIGLLMPRTAAASAAAQMLTRRLEHRLRHDLGHSYEVSLAWLALDAHDALASVFASGLLPDLGTVRAELLRVLAEFAADGPTADEREWYLDQLTRAAQDPDAVSAQLAYCAFNELVGFPHIDESALLDEARALTRVDVAAALAQASTHLTLFDGLTAPPQGHGWEAYPLYAASVVDGRRFEPATRRFWHPRGEELIVGADGVSWENRAGVERLTVRYERCLAVVCEGANAVLHGDDGMRVAVDAAYWRNGDLAVAAIRAAVPPAIVIEIDPPGGG